VQCKTNSPEGTRGGGDRSTQGPNPKDFRRQRLREERGRRGHRAGKIDRISKNLPRGKKKKVASKQPIPFLKRQGPEIEGKEVAGRGIEKKRGLLHYIQKKAL